MNPTWEDPIADEDDDENAYERGFVHGRDAVIFLIDATWGMFETPKKDPQKHQEEDTPFQLCLKCARSTLTNKIISSNKDLTGIVFFGTDKTKNTRNDTDFQHIYVFHDLYEPGAERVLETEELMSMDNQTFSSIYGHSDDFSLADALWVCGIMFSNCKYSLAHRRILLFTATDNPHDGKPQLQIQAKIKAKDLHESNIDIELFHLGKPNVCFDYSAFYKDIILTAEDEQYRITDASERIEDLLIRVRCKDHKKRSLGNLQFKIDEDVKVSFKMYKLVVPASRPTAVKLAKENNTELTTLVSTFLGESIKAVPDYPSSPQQNCIWKAKTTTKSGGVPSKKLCASNPTNITHRLQDTGEILLPSDIKKYQEYGAKKIYVTEDEVKQIRRIDEPGLLLMGFKPKSCLKVHYHIKPSVFLYPDEKAIEGSIRFCNALLLQCHKREYVPICRMIARRNDPPKFVALLPQLEHVDDHGNQTIPPGFHVITLPFMEDIRYIKGEKKHSPSEALVEKSKEIIKKLQFAYHPDSFENPVLQKHWRNIEALALNRDAPEEIIDYTLPTKDIIEKRAGKLIDEFKALLCPSASQPGGSYKRGMSSQGYGPPAKNPRSEEIVVPASLQQEAMTGMLPRFKVTVLKEFCRKNGIRCGTKKADIIEEIQKHYRIPPQIPQQQHIPQHQ